MRVAFLGPAGTFTEEALRASAPGPVEEVAYPSIYESVDLLRGNLFRVPAHHEMDFVGGAINLCEQALQIDRSAGAGRGDDEFHPAKESHSAGEDQSSRAAQTARDLTLEG